MQDHPAAAIHAAALLLVGGQHHDPTGGRLLGHGHAAVQLPGYGVPPPQHAVRRPLRHESQDCLLLAALSEGMSWYCILNVE